MRAPVLAAAAVVAIASAAQAGIVQIGPFFLDGLQEFPTPNASPGTGTATILVDNVTGDFTLNYEFQALTAPVTAAHFHLGAPGVAGGIILGLTVGGLLPPLPSGVTSAAGLGSGTFPAANLADLLAGNVYMNIHTSSFPGGEIRGQVVPAPGAFAAFGSAGLCALRRRRRG